MSHQSYGAAFISPEFSGGLYHYVALDGSCRGLVAELLPEVLASFEPRKGAEASRIAPMGASPEEALVSLIGQGIRLLKGSICPSGRFR